MVKRKASMSENYDKFKWMPLIYLVFLGVVGYIWYMERLQHYRDIGMPGVCYETRDPMLCKVLLEKK